MKPWQGTEAAASPDIRDEERLNSPCKVLQLQWFDSMCFPFFYQHSVSQKRESHSYRE